MGIFVVAMFATAPAFAESLECIDLSKTLKEARERVKREKQALKEGRIPIGNLRELDHAENRVRDLERAASTTERMTPEIPDKLSAELNRFDALRNTRTEVTKVAEEAPPPAPVPSPPVVERAPKVEPPSASKVQRESVAEARTREPGDRALMEEVARRVRLKRLDGDKNEAEALAKAIEKRTGLSRRERELLEFAAGDERLGATRGQHYARTTERTSPYETFLRELSRGRDMRDTPYYFPETAQSTAAGTRYVKLQREVLANFGATGDLERAVKATEQYHRPLVDELANMNALPADWQRLSPREKAALIRQKADREVASFADAWDDVKLSGIAPDFEARVYRDNKQGKEMFPLEKIRDYLENGSAANREKAPASRPVVSHEPRYSNGAGTGRNLVVLETDLAHVTPQTRQDLRAVVKRLGDEDVKEVLVIPARGAENLSAAERREARAMLAEFDRVRFPDDALAKSFSGKPFSQNVEQLAARNPGRAVTVLTDTRSVAEPWFGKLRGENVRYALAHRKGDPNFELASKAAEFRAGGKVDFVPVQSRLRPTAREIADHAEAEASRVAASATNTREALRRHALDVAEQSFTDLQKAHDAAAGYVRAALEAVDETTDAHAGLEAISKELRAAQKAKANALLYVSELANDSKVIAPEKVAKAVDELIQAQTRVLTAVDDARRKPPNTFVRTALVATDHGASAARDQAELVREGVKAIADGGRNVSTARFTAEHAGQTLELLRRARSSAEESRQTLFNVTHYGHKARPAISRIETALADAEKALDAAVLVQREALAGPTAATGKRLAEAVEKVEQPLARARAAAEEAFRETDGLARFAAEALANDIKFVDTSVAARDSQQLARLEEGGRAVVASEKKTTPSAAKEAQRTVASTEVPAPRDPQREIWNAPPAEAARQLEETSRRMRAGQIQKTEDLGVGLARPKKLTLSDGTAGLWRPYEAHLGDTPDGIRIANGAAELAAYRIDRQIGQNAVPLTVEREFEGKRGTMQLWVPGGTAGIEDSPAPLRMFDHLVDEPGRTGLDTVRANDRIVALGHGGAFGENGRALFRTEVEGVLDDVKRGVLTRPEAAEQLRPMLDARVLENMRETKTERWRELLGDVLDRGQLDAFLTRKDEILQLTERVRTEIGENAFRHAGHPTAASFSVPVKTADNGERALTVTRAAIQSLPQGAARDGMFDVLRKVEAWRAVEERVARIRDANPHGQGEMLGLLRERDEAQAYALAAVRAARKGTREDTPARHAVENAEREIAALSGNALADASRSTVGRERVRAAAEDVLTTQNTVGSLQVFETLHDLGKRSSSFGDLKKEVRQLNERVISAVRGPALSGNGETKLYLLDGHHQARALYDLAHGDYDALPKSIREVISKKQQEELRDFEGLKLNLRVTHTYGTKEELAQDFARSGHGLLPETVERQPAFKDALAKVRDGGDLLPREQETLVRAYSGVAHEVAKLKDDPIRSALGKVFHDEDLTANLRDYSQFLFERGPSSDAIKALGINERNALSPRVLEGIRGIMFDDPDSVQALRDLAKADNGPRGVPHSKLNDRAIDRAIARRRASPSYQVAKTIDDGFQVPAAPRLVGKAEIPKRELSQDRLEVMGRIWKEARPDDGFRDSVKQAAYNGRVTDAFASDLKDFRARLKSARWLCEATCEEPGKMEALQRLSGKLGDFADAARFGTKDEVKAEARLLGKLLRESELDEVDKDFKRMRAVSRSDVADRVEKAVGRVREALGHDRLDEKDLRHFRQDVGMLNMLSLFDASNPKAGVRDAQAFRAVREDYDKIGRMHDNMVRELFDGRDVTPARLSPAQRESIAKAADYFDRGASRSTVAQEEPRLFRGPASMSERTNFRRRFSLEELKKESDALISGVAGIEDGTKARVYEKVMADEFGLRLGDAVALSRNFTDDLPLDLSLGFVGRGEVVEITKTPANLPRALRWGQENVTVGKLTAQDIKELHGRSLTDLALPKGDALRVQSKPSLLERKGATYTLEGKLAPEVKERMKAYGIEARDVPNGRTRIEYARASTEKDLELVASRINAVANAGHYTPEYVAAFSHQELALFHGFKGANGRTGRLLGQLTFDKLTGKPALFPPSFHKELEFSADQLAGDLLKSQGRQFEQPVHKPRLSRDWGGLAREADFVTAMPSLPKDVGPPIARVVPKELPKEILARESNAKKGSTVKVAVASLPDDVTRAEGTLYFGKPAKSMEEVDRGLKNLFQYGRENRGAATFDVDAHVGSTKTGARSGLFSTTRDLSIAKSFGPDGIDTLGYVAVIEGRGTPGLDLAQLERHFRDARPDLANASLRLSLEEKEVALTGIDPRQVRGAWVKHVTPRGSAEMRFVANPNYDPKWTYEAAAHPERASRSVAVRETHSVDDLVRAPSAPVRDAAKLADLPWQKIGDREVAFKAYAEGSRVYVREAGEVREFRGPAAEGLISQYLKHAPLDEEMKNYRIASEVRSEGHYFKLELDGSYKPRWQVDPEDVRHEYMAYALTDGNRGLAEELGFVRRELPGGKVDVSLPSPETMTRNLEASGREPPVRFVSYQEGFIPEEKWLEFVGQGKALLGTRGYYWHDVDLHGVGFLELARRGEWEQVKSLSRRITELRDAPTPLPHAELERSLKEWVQVVEHASSDAPLLRHRADALRAAGRAEEALRVETEEIPKVWRKLQDGIAEFERRVPQLEARAGIKPSASRSVVAAEEKLPPHIGKGLPEAREINALVDTLRERVKASGLSGAEWARKTHVPEFADQIAGVLKFADTTIHGQEINGWAKLKGSLPFGSNDRIERLKLLEKFTAEAEQRRKDGRVTYEWWNQFNHRVSILTTPADKRSNEFAGQVNEFQKMLREGKPPAWQTDEGYRRVAEELRLKRKGDAVDTLGSHNVAEHFPDFAVVPVTNGDFGLAALNDLYGKGIGIKGHVAQPLKADGHLMHGDVFYIHDGGHASVMQSAAERNELKPKDLSNLREHYLHYRDAISTDRREAFEFAYFLATHEHNEPGLLFRTNFMKAFSRFGTDEATLKRVMDESWFKGSVPAWASKDRASAERFLKSVDQELNLFSRSFADARSADRMDMVMHTGPIHIDGKIPETGAHAQYFDHLYHGFSQLDPHDLIENGLSKRGNNWNLRDHAEGKGIKGSVFKAEETAFRGTTVEPIDSEGMRGAAVWAGEGGYVVELRGFHGWDVNAILNGRRQLPDGSFANHLLTEEYEVAIPAHVPREYIYRIIPVKKHPRNENMVMLDYKNAIMNPHFMGDERGEITRGVPKGSRATVAEEAPKSRIPVQDIRAVRNEGLTITKSKDGSFPRLEFNWEQKSEISLPLASSHMLPNPDYIGKFDTGTIGPHMGPRFHITNGDPSKEFLVKVTTSGGVYEAKLVPQRADDLVGLRASDFTKVGNPDQHLSSWPTQVRSVTIAPAEPSPARLRLLGDVEMTFNPSAADVRGERLVPDLFAAQARENPGKFAQEEIDAFTKAYAGLHREENLSHAQDIAERGPDAVKRELARYGLESMPLKKDGPVSFKDFAAHFTNGEKKLTIPSELGQFAAAHGENPHALQIIAIMHGLSEGERTRFVDTLRKVLSPDDPSSWVIWSGLFDGFRGDGPHSPSWWKHTTPAPAVATTREPLRYVSPLVPPAPPPPAVPREALTTLADRATASPNRAVLHFDRGVELDGKVTQLLVDDKGAPYYVRTEGPTAVRDRLGSSPARVMPGQDDARHATGYSTPIGDFKVAGTTHSSATLDANALGELKGKDVALAYDSGIKVTGKIDSFAADASGKPKLLTLTDAEVVTSDGTKLYQKDWGPYDLLVSKEVRAVGVRKDAAKEPPFVAVNGKGTPEFLASRSVVHFEVPKIPGEQPRLTSGRIASLERRNPAAALGYQKLNEEARNLAYLRERYLLAEGKIRNDSELRELEAATSRYAHAAAPAYGDRHTTYLKQQLRWLEAEAELASSEGATEKLARIEHQQGAFGAELAAAVKARANAAARDPKAAQRSAIEGFANEELARAYGIQGNLSDPLQGKLLGTRVARDQAFDARLVSVAESYTARELGKLFKVDDADAGKLAHELADARAALRETSTPRELRDALKRQTRDKVNGWTEKRIDVCLAAHVCAAERVIDEMPTPELARARYETELARAPTRDRAEAAAFARTGPVSRTLKEEITDRAIRTDLLANEARDLRDRAAKAAEARARNQLLDSALQADRARERMAAEVAALQAKAEQLRNARAPTLAEEKLADRQVAKVMSFLSRPSAREELARIPGLENLSGTGLDGFAGFKKKLAALPPKDFARAFEVVDGRPASSSPRLERALEESEKVRSLVGDNPLLAGESLKKADLSKEELALAKVMGAEKSDAAVSKFERDARARVAIAEAESETRKLGQASRSIAAVEDPADRLKSLPALDEAGRKELAAVIKASGKDASALLARAESLAKSDPDTFESWRAALVHYSAARKTMDEDAAWEQGVRRMLKDLYGDDTKKIDQLYTQAAPCLRRL